MGASISCCKANTPRVGRKYNYHRKENFCNHLFIKEEDCFNLQHISEREPEDLETDPSSHPKVGPLFMQRSRSDIKVDLKDKRKSVLNLESRPLNKSSSCSTIYLDDSTVSRPDKKNTIKCVALAIYYHIKNSSSNPIFDIFDERHHPLTKDGVNDIDLKKPDHENIYVFIRSLFHSAQLPPECAIITLVYLERLLTYAEIEIVPASWKRIVLGAIILASKVWDDQAVWNVDYCQILEDISVEDMNELERQFLELLQFNINVPSSIYTKYYFELRTLANKNDFAFQIQPLSKERAQKLEAMSKAFDEKLTLDLPRNGFRKWSSVESVLISPKRQSKAIIS